MKTIILLILSLFSSLVTAGINNDFSLVTRAMCGLNKGVMSDTGNLKNTPVCHYADGSSVIFALASNWQKGVTTSIRASHNAFSVGVSQGYPANGALPSTILMLFTPSASSAKVSAARNSVRKLSSPYTKVHVRTLVTTKQGLKVKALGAMSLGYQ